MALRGDSTTHGGQPPGERSAAAAASSAPDRNAAADGGPVKVLVVDDCRTYRAILTQSLEALDNIEIVGTASNGKIALQRIEQLRPEVVTLDIEMPELDGNGVLERLQDRPDAPRCIVLTGVSRTAADAAVRAMRLGAFDFVRKPAANEGKDNRELLVHRLERRIHLAAKKSREAAVRRKAAAERTSARAATHATPATARAAAAPRLDLPLALGNISLVAIGSSTGGPDALQRFFRRIPANITVPIVVAQHMPPLFTDSLARSLDRSMALEFREAKDGDMLRPGLVLIAPGGKHLRVREDDGALYAVITEEEAANHCYPCVDFLFESVAEVLGRKAVAAVFTGMGRDGAEGAAKMKARGARILAQDEATSVVYGMPKAIADRGLADMIAPVEDIAEQVKRATCR